MPKNLGRLFVQWTELFLACCLILQQHQHIVCLNLYYYYCRAARNLILKIWENRQLFMSGTWTLKPGITRYTRSSMDMRWKAFTWDWPQIENIKPASALLSEFSTGFDTKDRWWSCYRKFQVFVYFNHAC